MVVRKNDCCDCATDLYPCIGMHCNLRNVPHYYCDECGDEVGSGELYWYEEQQLCQYCVINKLEVVYE